MMLQKVTFAIALFVLSVSFNVAQSNQSLSDILPIQEPKIRSPIGDCPLMLFDKSEMPPPKARDVDFNGNCFVELEDVSINDYQIVDVRNPLEFEQGHIKNSINIPLHQLPQKHFLRKKNILLINNGLPQFEMGQFCQMLTAQGFDQIKILKGGIHNWLSTDQQIESTKLTTDDYNLVKLEQFTMDYDNDLTQVVNIKANDNKKSRLYSDSKLISLEGGKSIREQLRTIANARSSEYKQIVVILSEEDYILTKSLLNEKILKDIYFLISDKTELEKFNRIRKAVNKARLDGPRAMHCGT